MQIWIRNTGKNRPTLSSYWNAACRGHLCGHTNPALRGRGADSRNPPTAHWDLLRAGPHLHRPLPPTGLGELIMYCTVVTVHLRETKEDSPHTPPPRQIYLVLFTKKSVSHVLSSCYWLKDTHARDFHSSALNLFLHLSIQNTIQSTFSHFLWKRRVKLIVVGKNLVKTVCFDSIQRIQRISWIMHFWWIRRVKHSVLHRKCRVKQCVFRDYTVFANIRLWRRILRLI